MKKAYISFAITALWLTTILTYRGDFAIGIAWPKGWRNVDPAITLWLGMALFYGLLFGWIAPLAFGFWSLRKQRQ